MLPALSGWVTRASALLLGVGAACGLALAQPGGTAPVAAADAKVDKNAAGDPVDAETKRVYLVNMQGVFGRDLSATPFKSILADAKKAQPDYLVFRVDFQFNVGGRERMAFENDPRALYELETARQLITLFTEDLINDTTWGKKPRVVMWVRRALGGSAFLPFAAPDIYYTSDGIQGGIGGLERTAAGMQDQRVREKMWGIMKARAEGLALMGGHDARLLRAMMEYRFKLSYTMEGGKARLSEDYLGEVIKEDPLEDEARRDNVEQVARLEGNDTLTLRTELATRLGLARGKADTLEEIMDDQGFGRNYQVIDGRAKRILDNWSSDVRRAEDEFQSLWRDFNDIQVTGQTPQERNQKRGAQLGVLRKVKALLDRYREAIDPSAIQGAPEQWDTEIDIMMERIRQRIRTDK